MHVCGRREIQILVHSLKVIKTLLSIDTILIEHGQIQGRASPPPHCKICNAKKVGMSKRVATKIPLLSWPPFTLFLYLLLLSVIGGHTQNDSKLITELHRQETRT